MKRAVITGYGLITPLGDCPVQHFDAIVSACQTPDQPAAGFHTGGRVSDALLKDQLKGRNLRPLDRTSRMLAAAAGNALAHAGIERDSPNSIGLVSGTMFASAATIAAFDCRAMEEGPGYASALDFANSVINASTGQTAIWHRLRGENTTIATGQSAGLRAIGRALGAIRTGRENVLLAGGVEELSDELFSAFLDSGLLTQRDTAIPFAGDRDGFLLREGAAVVLLEDKRHAVSRGAKILGEVIGHGSSFDYLNREDAAVSVDSIHRSMHLALQDADVAPVEVDVVACSANGSPAIDHHESLAIDALFEHTRTTPDGGPCLFVPKIAQGESNGAAGPLQLIATLNCLQSGTVPQPAAARKTNKHDTIELNGPVRTALVNAISYDGHSCSVVMRTQGAAEWN